MLLKDSPHKEVFTGEDTPKPVKEEPVETSIFDNLFEQGDEIKLGER